VLKYTVLEICYKKLDCLEDVCSFLRLMKPGFKYCIELITASNNCMELITLLSQIIQPDDLIWEYYTSTGTRIEKSRYGWRVTNGNQMVATKILLKMRHPELLSIQLNQKDSFTTNQLVELTEAISQTQFKGSLLIYHKSSLDEFLPIDSAILPLQNSRYLKLEYRLNLIQLYDIFF